MKRQFFTLLAGLLCLSGSVAQAAKVDTLSVRSNAMNKNVTAERAAAYIHYLFQR